MGDPEPRMKMAPFPCPHCGHAILVDRVRRKIVDAFEVLTVGQTFDADEMLAGPTITVADVFTIRGRGTMITGDATGEFAAGDLIACGEMITQVIGIERFFPGPKNPIGLLIRLPFEQAAQGQVWTQGELGDLAASAPAMVTALAAANPIYDTMCCFFCHSLAPVPAANRGPAWEDSSEVHEEGCPWWMARKLLGLPAWPTDDEMDQ